MEHLSAEGWFDVCISYMIRLLQLDYKLEVFRGETRDENQGRS